MHVGWLLLVPTHFCGAEENIPKHKMTDSDTYLTFENGEGKKAYYNQFPRSLKSDFLVRRNTGSQSLDSVCC